MLTQPIIEEAGPTLSPFAQFSILHQSILSLLPSTSPLLQFFPASPFPVVNPLPYRSSFLFLFFVVISLKSSSSKSLLFVLKSGNTVYCTGPRTNITIDNQHVYPI